MYIERKYTVSFVYILPQFLTYVNSSSAAPVVAMPGVTKGILSNVSSNSNQAGPMGTVLKMPAIAGCPPITGLPKLLIFVKLRNGWKHFAEFL